MSIDARHFFAPPCVGERTRKAEYRAMSCVVAYHHEYIKALLIKSIMPRLERNIRPPNAIVWPEKYARLLSISSGCTREAYLPIKLYRDRATLQMVEKRCHVCLSTVSLLMAYSRKQRSEERLLHYVCRREEASSSEAIHQSMGISACALKRRW